MNKHIITLYRYCMFKRLWANTWKKWLWASASRTGVEFHHKGDQIIYVWPWKRVNKEHKFISLCFTGNGEFGDVSFKSLAEIDRQWDEFNKFQDQESLGVTSDSLFDLI